MAYSKSELDSLRQAIKMKFSPMWQLNDPAHREEHFAEVEKWGNYINDKLGLGYDPKLILFVAWFHDLFTWDRDNHHLMSAHWIETTTDLLITANLDPEETKLVANACREHRASYKGEYSHEFCELMACADRGVPGDVTGMLSRAMDYRLHRGIDMCLAMRGAVEHMKEKFGSQGYARYPEMYIRAFGDELSEQRRVIDAL